MSGIGGGAGIGGRRRVSRARDGMARRRGDLDGAMRAARRCRRQRASRRRRVPAAPGSRSGLRGLHRWCRRSGRRGGGCRSGRLLRARVIAAARRHAATPRRYRRRGRAKRRLTVPRETHEGHDFRQGTWPAPSQRLTRRGCGRKDPHERSAAGDLAGLDAGGAGVDTLLVATRAGTARTAWMFGFQRRLVRRCECDTDLPKPGPFPQTSHTAAILRTPRISILGGQRPQAGDPTT